MARTVGARELKTRLGAYIDEVRRGATLIVTDRGKPVAELRPVSGGRRERAARLDTLCALGVLRRESRSPLAPFRPLRMTGPGLSATVVEDRRDRV